MHPKSYKIIGTEIVTNSMNQKSPETFGTPLIYTLKARIDKNGKKAAWSFPFPATVGRGEFVNQTRRTTSLAVGSSISCPPAAGGWGIGDPRPIYSVGFSRWPAGLAKEVVLRSARRFGEKLILSGGGALRSSAVEPSPYPSSKIAGSAELLFPSPAPAWRSGRFVLKLLKAVMWSLAMEMTSCGVGSPEPATGDFPSAKGLHLNQAFEGCNGGSTPPAASGSSSTSGSRGPDCNFSFTGPGCKSEALISLSFSRK